MLCCVFPRSFSFAGSACTQRRLPRVRIENAADKKIENGFIEQLLHNIYNVCLYKEIFSLGFHGRGAVLEILTSDNTNGVLSFTHFVMQQQVQLASASAFAGKARAVIGNRKRFKLNLVIDCVPFVRSFISGRCDISSSREKRADTYRRPLIAAIYADSYYCRRGRRHLQIMPANGRRASSVPATARGSPLLAKRKQAASDLTSEWS